MRDITFTFGKRDQAEIPRASTRASRHLNLQSGGISKSHFSFALHYVALSTAILIGGVAIDTAIAATVNVSAAEWIKSNATPVAFTAAVIGGLVALGSGALAFFRRAGHAVEEAQRLEALFDVLAEGIAVCSGMQVVAVNTSLCNLVGIRSSDAGDLMISHFIQDTDAIDKLLWNRAIDLETQLMTRDGTVIDVEITARTISYRGSNKRLLEIRDIRDRKETQRRVSFLAHHDSLTALPNREAMQARLAECIESSLESDKRCAVIWIDLDRFKEINDIHGHAMGDQILQVVAEKLRFELPAHTLIARLGGDEFVVLCEEVRDREEARLIGQQLRRLLNRPITINGISMMVGASIGVAVYPDDANNADDLLKNADLALYHAKAAGRAKCRSYTEALGNERQRRIMLRGQLRTAIDNGEIQAFFQPLVRTHDLRVGGFEVLGRWFHPELGSVPPPEFIKLAEENGLIDPLTDVILEQAIAAAKHWPNNVRISVNISPVQINSELVDRVRHIISSKDFDPRRLELEVTEDVLIKDFDQTASMFARLRSFGVQVAMDDFGAGYTSLGNLRRLNFDRVKIDRIFTGDLPNHRRSAAILRSILVLARELDLDVTVEGVETKEQFDFLCGEGCREVQGFLFSQPKPFSAFADSSALQLAPLAPKANAVGPVVVEIAQARTKRAS
ncbi:MAG TPA: EAL domain-containing protein [Xanthobacteraceae bacterium]|nr:EAL domain-containing protein [Xanthobacteraceae bacterium]